MALQLIDPDEKLHNPPGCGLGLYAGLLFVVFLLGLAGMAIATVGIVGQALSENPRELRAGVQIDPWRFQPLRDAGLLGPDELPAAFHDESRNLTGDPACAMTLDAVLRVQEGQGRRLPFDQMASIEATERGGQEVLLMSPKPGSAAPTIGCVFGPGEGAMDMLRQVQVELLRREQYGQAP